MNGLSTMIRPALAALLLFLLPGCPPPEPVKCKCDGSDPLCQTDITGTELAGDLSEVELTIPPDQETEVVDGTAIDDSGDVEVGLEVPFDADIPDVEEDKGAGCQGNALCFENGICAGKVVTWCDGDEWRCIYDLVPDFEWGGEVTCDGLDNDCDGQTDEDLVPPPDTCLFEGVCAASVQACTNGKWDCGYDALPDYQPEPELSCDGLDNDCDGTPDDGLCKEGTPGDKECLDSGTYHVLQGDGSSWGVPKICDASTACMGLGICTRKDAWKVNEFDSATQSRPTVARLGEGAAAVWESNGQDGSESGIYLRTYGPSGEELLAEQKLNLFTKGAQQHPAAVAMGAESFFAGWESADQDGSGLGLFGRIVFAGGTAGSELVLPVTTTVDQRDLTLVALGDPGDVIAIWADNSQDNFRLKGGHIDAAGWPWALEMDVTTQDKDDDTRPAMAVLGTDAAVVVWERLVGIQSDIMARRVDGLSGETWQAGTEIPVATGLAENELRAAVIGTGDYIHLAWLEQQAKRICVRRFKTDLSSAGDAVCLNAESGGVQAVALAVLDGSDVAVAWQEGPSQNHKVKLATFAEGATFGATILADLGAMDADGSLSMVSFPGGKVLVAWARTGIATGLDVWARFVQM